MRQRVAACVCALGMLVAEAACGQTATTAATAVSNNSSYIEPDGTARVGRIVPVPASLSPQAQAMLRHPETDAKVETPLAQRRAGTDAYTARAKEQWQKVCPVKITNDTIAGVPVRRITPPDVTANGGKVLLDLHGGGFDSDSGSYTESIPIAYYARVPVVAALYRLAPEHPFPAAVDDAVAVYRELLKTHKPEQIAIYGTSAGAILTGEVAVKLKQLSLPSRPHWASSAGSAISRGWVIRSTSTGCADSADTWRPRAMKRHSLRMWAALTRRIRYFRRSMPISRACPRRCL